MKKFIVLLMALLLPLSAFEMSADNSKPVIKKIPLRFEKGTKLNRTLDFLQIEAIYYGPMSCVHTIASEDLGEVTVSVTNSSTGEFWTDTFDTSVENQSSLQISSTSGLYEIEYITASGNIYEGEFSIE